MLIKGQEIYLQFTNYTGRGSLEREGGGGGSDTNKKLPPFQLHFGVILFIQLETKKKPIAYFMIGLYLSRFPYFKQ